MRIRMKTNPITPYGSFGVGDVLNDDSYPKEFLEHLVNDCNAAEFLDYETKIDMEYEPVKKPLSLPLSEQGKVLTKKTSRLRKKQK